MNMFLGLRKREFHYWEFEITIDTIENLNPLAVSENQKISISWERGDKAKNGSTPPTPLPKPDSQYSNQLRFDFTFRTRAKFEEDKKSKRLSMSNLPKLWKKKSMKLHVNEHNGNLKTKVAWTYDVNLSEFINDKFYQTQVSYPLKGWSEKHPDAILKITYKSWPEG